MATARKKNARKRKLPIAYWSHSSLVSYLRNPLTWYKRYVQKVYDLPKGAAAVIGSAGHLALEHFYKGAPKDTAIAAGLASLRSFPDSELQFGAAVRTKKAKREMREAMERDYLQAIGFYLARAPRYNVVDVEMRGMANVEGLPLPVKAISDLVIESKGNPGCLDIVDHKFVATFTKSGIDKPLFALQAIFNYYTVTETFGKPVKRFIVIECKKSKNKNGGPQLRRYTLNFDEAGEHFRLFHQLLKEATAELKDRKTYLPNPSDMFEGEHSFDLYRLGLGSRVDEGEPEV